MSAFKVGSQPVVSASRRSTSADAPPSLTQKRDALESSILGLEAKMKSLPFAPSSKAARAELKAQVAALRAQLDPVRVQLGEAFMHGGRVIGLEEGLELMRSKNAKAQESSLGAKVVGALTGGATTSLNAAIGRQVAKVEERAAQALGKDGTVAQKRVLGSAIADALERLGDAREIHDGVANHTASTATNMVVATAAVATGGLSLAATAGLAATGAATRVGVNSALQTEYSAGQGAKDAALGAAEGAMQVAGNALGRKVVAVAAKGLAAAKPLTEAALKSLSPEKLSSQAVAQGIADIHNGWLSEAVKKGTVLGLKAENAAARPFAVPVQVDAKGALALGKLDAAQRAFIEKLGLSKGASAGEAFAAGSKEVLAMVQKNNGNALHETIALVAQHVESRGSSGLVRGASYLDDAAKLAAPAVPTQATTLSKAAVEQELKHTQELVAFLESKGSSPVSATSVPPHLRQSYELFAKKHDLWVKERLGWKATPDADFVPTHQLPASRLVLDAAPLLGALKAMVAAL